jgi:hypothetical protein
MSCRTDREQERVVELRANWGEKELQSSEGVEENEL